MCPCSDSTAAPMGEEKRQIHYGSAFEMSARVSFVRVAVKETLRGACFLLHKREDLESQEGKASLALR